MNIKWKEVKFYDMSIYEKNLINIPTKNHTESLRVSMAIKYRSIYVSQFYFYILKNK